MDLLSLGLAQPVPLMHPQGLGIGHSREGPGPGRVSSLCGDPQEDAGSLWFQLSSVLAKAV